MADPKKLDEQAQASGQIIPAMPVPDPAAALMEEILEQTVQDALNRARPDQLIGANDEEELLKGTAYHSSAWLHAPGYLELLSQADFRLTRVANVGRTNEAQVNVVENVYANLVPATKLLVVRDAPDHDLTAEPVRRYPGQSGAWINLFRLLKSAKLTVPTGYRELYAVSYVPKTSPLWPALVIDLGKPKLRRQEPKRKKEDQENKG